MKTFLKYINLLTQKAKEENLDPFTFNLAKLIEPSENELKQIHKETKGIEMVAIDLFWELTEEVYKKLMLRTIEKDLEEFFIQVQSLDKQDLFIEYSFSPWDKFRINVRNTSLEQDFELKLEYAEDQIKKLLEYLDIDDPHWYQDLYDFDYKFNFETEVETLFREIVFEAWKKAMITTSHVDSGSIQEINGGSYIYDLNTGNVIN